MHSKMLRLLLVVLAPLLIWTGQSPAMAAPPPGSTPVMFYKSLANAVTDLRGRALFYFNDCGRPGDCVYRTTSLAAGPIDWRIAHGTVATTVLDYENSHLVKASLTFSKPVHVWLHTDQGSSFAISHIDYDADGHLINDDSKPDNPPHYGGATRAHRIFELTTDPSQLLTTRIFANVGGSGGGPISSCDTSNQNCAPTTLSSMFYEIEIKSSSVDPGLLAMLGPVKGNARSLTLVAPQSTAEPISSLDLASGSSVTLDNVQYYTDEHFVTGNIIQINLNISGGQLGTSNMLLRLTPGSTFVLQDITFTHDPSGPVANSLSAESGSLDIPSLGAGSTIYISQGGEDSTGDSYITTASNSSLQLRNVSLGTKDNGNFHISWDNSSRESLFFSSGRINVGPGNFVNLGGGRISTSLSGQWTQGNSPHVSGSDSTVDAMITGGTIAINAVTKLPLGAGHLYGEHLEFDSSRKPVLTGNISTFTLSIASNSTVAIPGGFAVVTNGNATLSNDVASTGLTLVAQQPYPLGRYILNLPFSRLSTTSGNDFSITNGAAIFPIETLADGTIQTPTNLAWTFNGTLLITPRGASQPLSLPLIVSNGNFKAPQGTNSMFTGQLSGNVMSGLDLGFTTSGQGLNGQPTIQDHADMSIYPVTVRLTIPVPQGGGAAPVALIPPTSFKVSNGLAQIDGVSLTLPFQLIVAGGGGEHEDIRDPGSTTGHDGNSEVAGHAVWGWQEVLQDKNLTGLGPAGCTIHFYVGPTTHSGTTKLTLALANKKLNVGISSIELSDPFVQGRDWDKDGCDGKTIGGIAGAILGALTLGPGGAVGVGLGGFIVGGAANNRVDAIISERIGEFVNGYQGNWSIQY